MKKQTKSILISCALIGATVVTIAIVRSCSPPNCAPMAFVHRPGIELMKSDAADIIYKYVYKELGCDDILRNGLFRYDYVRYNESYRYYFYDYVYQSNFQSSDDVINAGLSLDLPTEIGVPLGINGSFDRQRHSEWRSEYERERTEMQSRDIAYESIRRYADTSIVNAWSKCKYWEAKNKIKGLQIMLLDAGPEEVLLTASYDPTGNSDPDATVSRMQITGGKVIDAECSPFRKNQKIGPGGIATIVKRERGKPMNIILETNRSTKTDKFPAPPDLNIMYFTSSSEQVYRGDEVEIKWEIAGSKSVNFQGEPVPPRMSKKIGLDSTTTFELMATGLYNDVINAKKKVEVIDRPVKLAAVRLTLFVPAWADGKDDNTHIAVNLYNSRNAHVAGYLNNRDDWPIENGGFTEPMGIVVDGQSDELRKNLMSDCTVVITKWPDGRDKVTLYVQLQYTFSDGTTNSVSTDVIQMLEQGQQTASSPIRMAAFAKFNFVGQMGLK